MSVIVPDFYPGQGKSTLTQFITQVYRLSITDNEKLISIDGKDYSPVIKRFPFRIELKNYSEFIHRRPNSSVESFIAEQLTLSSGGHPFSVEHVQDIIENGRIIIFFDGLDEVGNDSLRILTVDQINLFISRSEDLGCDIQVVLTTRPSNINDTSHLKGNFIRLPILSLSNKQIDSYTSRWIENYESDSFEKNRIKSSFERRRNEEYVKALIKNPMQLSILLDFIKIKGEAFPTHRSELYRDYFKIVIDRDVEKNDLLKIKRQLVESLHEFLGYKIHSLSEIGGYGGSLTRDELLLNVRQWMADNGHNALDAEDIFKLGRDRLGLVNALSGEGSDTKYGFDIQPIREYFAAAFINNQVRGDTDKIFLELATRPYWREVALFLAGLRRDKEKSSLVASLKYLDDKTENWRYSGREMLLQIVDDGVLSNPPQVLLQTLDSLYDLIDYRKIPVCDIDRNIISTISKATSVLKTKNYLSYTKNLFIYYCVQNDLLMAETIAKIIFSAYEEEDIIIFLEEAESIDPDILIKAKILWSTQVGLNLSNLSKIHNFWGEDFYRAADILWSAACVNVDVLLLDIPDSILEVLWEIYLYNPLNIRPSSQKNIIRILNSNTLIIKLIGMNILLSNTHRLIYAGDIISELKDINYEFIDNYNPESSYNISAENITKYIFKLSKDISNKVPVLYDKIVTYFESLKISSIKDSIASMRLAEAVMNLATQVTEVSPNIYANLEIAISLSKERYNENNLLTYMKQYFAKFFDNSIDKKSCMKYYESYFSTNQTELPAFFSSDRRAFPDFYVIDKKTIRISINNINHANESHRTDWIFKQSLSTNMIYIIVENTTENLEDVLRKISTLNFVDYQGAVNLNTGSLFKIVNIAKNTTDKNILIGALLSIYNSRFIKKLGKEKFREILYLNPNIGTRIYKILTEEVMYSTKDENDKRLIFGISEFIAVDDQAPTSLRRVAASYLSKSKTDNLPPIYEIEEDLEISVKHMW